MNTQNVLVWNPRGLNSRARRSVVRDVVVKEQCSVVYLQETKLESMSVPMSLELTGPDFDYLCLPSVGASGGVIIAWRRDCWVASQPCLHQFSATVRLRPIQGRWLTSVYGPTTSHLKPLLLQELLDLQNTCAGAWVVCGDFNLILQPQDKNNGRLHLRHMRRFRDVLQDLQLLEQ